MSKPRVTRGATRKKRGRPSNHQNLLTTYFKEEEEEGERLAEDVYSIARKRLHTSAVPESLPCRGKEFEDIYNFVESKLKEGVGGCMYISGVPGTGKTATVHEAIKALESGYKGNKIPSFDFVEVNGLRLTDPYQTYVQIYQQLYGKKIASRSAAETLNDYFVSSDPRDEFVVLLVDELDLLCTRKQTILYHLFDWPNRPNSNLIVIAIANAMDLPERVMMSRISSRLGLTRLTFQPYTHSELQSIVFSRLQGLKAFDPDAVQLVARKVAAVSGDARRTLDICRRATQIAEDADVKGIVSMKHVDKALQEMFSSPKIVAIREASVQEQTLLSAIAQDFRISGLEEAVFRDVFTHHATICRFEKYLVPSSSQLFEVANRLFEMRLILIDNNKCHLLKKMRLNVSTDDIDFALKKQF